MKEKRLKLLIEEEKRIIVKLLKTLKFNKNKFLNGNRIFYE